MKNISKNTIFVSIILLLMIGIFFVQYKIRAVDSNKVAVNLKPSDQGIVMGVKDTNNDINISLPKINDIVVKKNPQKKDNIKNPLVYAKNIILMDKATGYILYEKNAYDAVSIASTTKIMTAVIVLENYNLNEVVTISQNAATQIGSDINLRTDEKITVKNLLYALLVKSGNDAAMALAEHMTKGKEEFVRRMNEKAKFLGLKNTNYQDPAGLDDAGLSSAYDLAVLTSYALEKQTFSDIVQTANYTINSADGKLAHELETSNRLIKSDEPLYYQPAVGVKTGFTPPAGHCFVSAAKKDNNEIIGVVLNTNESTVDASAKESRKLLIWGFDSFDF